MHNKIYDDITIFTKFFALIFIIISFIISNSVYIALFTTLLVLYLFILNIGRLKRYLKLIKSYIIPILIGLIVIILFAGIKLIPIYKYMIIILLVHFFMIDMTFEKVHTLIYKIIRHKYISYKIALFLYRIHIMITSKEDIDKMRNKRDNKRLYFKRYLLVRMQYAKEKTTKLDYNLKANYYTVTKQKSNLISIVTFILFLYILIIAIIRK